MMFNGTFGRKHGTEISPILCREYPNVYTRADKAETLKLYGLLTNTNMESTDWLLKLEFYTPYVDVEDSPEQEIATQVRLFWRLVNCFQ